MRHIGQIERLQVQLDRLKKGTGPDRYYDTAALCLVPALLLTSKGVIGIADGKELLDVHHTDHEYSRQRDAAGISFNFVSHYTRMRDRLGPHVQDGCGGENILIATERFFELEQLARGLVIETQDSVQGRLVQVGVAHPCVPFSTYVLSRDIKPNNQTLKNTLHFLDGGTRGFYCEWVGEPQIVRPGNQVFILD